MLVIYPYKMTSQSAKSLSHSLKTKGVQQVRRVHSDGKFKNNFYRSNLIVNWGSSTKPQWWKEGTKVLNHWDNVDKSVNKLTTFHELDVNNVSIPEWTESTEVAQSWIDDGHKVYGRKILTGHSGAGINIFDSETICSSMECPLYTKATKADYEYRVHVFKGMVIDAQQKKKKNGHEGGIRGIRNHANGWIYAREDVTFPIPVLEQSIKAVAALELDFGAVDVGYNTEESKAYVYEVNSAPGLQGTTLENYTNTIKEYYNAL